MAYTFTYYERQFMLKYIDFLDSLVIKSTFDAGLTETKESAYAGELYTLAKFGRDTIFNYVITIADLTSIGAPQNLINIYKVNKSEFYHLAGDTLLQELLTIYRNRTIANYKEINSYYLALNGEPDDPSQYVIIEDIFDGGFFPIHTFNDANHAKMWAYLVNNNGEELNRIIDREYAAGHDYEYLRHLIHRVPYHIARDAENFNILYANESLLSVGDINTFYESYHIAKLYVLEVPYITSYAKTEELYDRFMGISILFLTTLKFISAQMVKYLRNDFPTRQEKKLFLSQYNLESLVDIIDNDTIIMELINHVDEFIALKGSDEVITKILSLFGTTDIDVYKYLLLKTINSDSITKDIIIDPTKKRQDNYDISLVKIPINVVAETRSLAKYISDKTQRVPLSNIAMKDAYFGDTTGNPLEAGNPKQEFVEYVENLLKNNEQFSMFYTKYLGIVAHVDTARNLIQSVYLFTTAIMGDPDTMDTIIPDDELMPNVTVRDLIAAINYITCLRHAVSDEIIQDVNAISQFIGFNPNPNLDELKAMDEYILPDDEGVTVQLPSLVEDEDIFIVKTSLEAETLPDEWKRPNAAVATYYYNLDKHDKLIQRMLDCQDYNEYIGLKQIFNYNMYCRAILDTFNGAATYTEYLNSRDNALKSYIDGQFNLATGSQWYSDDGSSTEQFRNMGIQLISQFLTIMLKVLSVSDNTVDAALSTYVDTVMKFTKIINTIELFKHYTTSFSTSDTVNVFNNPRDCLIKLFDVVGSEKGTGIVHDSVALYLYHHLYDHGNEKEWTKVSIKHIFADKSNGSGETDVFVTDKAVFSDTTSFPAWLTIWGLLKETHNVKPVSLVTMRHLLSNPIINPAKTDITVINQIDVYPLERRRERIDIIGLLNGVHINKPENLINIRHSLRPLLDVGSVKTDVSVTNHIDVFPLERRRSHIILRNLLHIFQEIRYDNYITMMHKLYIMKPELFNELISISEEIFEHRREEFQDVLSINHQRYEASLHPEEVNSTIQLRHELVCLQD